MLSIDYVDVYGEVKILKMVDKSDGKSDLGLTKHDTNEAKMNASDEHKIKPREASNSTKCLREVEEAIGQLN